MPTDPDRRVVTATVIGVPEPGTAVWRADGERTRVQLQLARPGRAACVSVPHDTVREFLDRTERAVPSGSERSGEAIDALLARLLGAEPPDA